MKVEKVVSATNVTNAQQRLQGGHASQKASARILREGSSGKKAAGGNASTPPALTSGLSIEAASECTRAKVLFNPVVERRWHPAFPLDGLELADIIAAPVAAAALAAKKGAILHRMALGCYPGRDAFATRVHVATTMVGCSGLVLTR